MYRESASNVQNAVSEPITELYIWGWFVHLRPILYTFEADLYIWGRSVHLRPILCTFEAETIYFVMWCVWANQTDSASNVQLSDWLKCIENQPQMYRESASNVQNSVSEPITELYIWGWFVHLRPILYTFEADLYIWGRSVHLRPILCTFEAEIIYFVMWCVWANQTDSASNVQLSDWLKCIENRPQMYRESASNVRTFEADRTLPGKAVHAAVKSARLARRSDALAW